MYKNEQDMIRKIKEKSEQVPVPKALEPRQIEAKLAGKKKKVWTPARIGGLAAACLVLIVGVMVCQNYFKMEDATRDDKIAGSDVTISDSTKVESAAEYKDVYAYLEKYKKDQERDSAYTSSWARSLNDIRVDESADSKASGDAAQIMEESSTAAADTGMASGSYSETISTSFIRSKFSPLLISTPIATLFFSLVCANNRSAKFSIKSIGRLSTQ